MSNEKIHVNDEQVTDEQTLSKKEAFRVEVAKQRAEKLEKKAKSKVIRKRMIQYCSRYMPFILVAIFVAGIGTILQILGPEQVGNMANEIEAGVTPGGLIDFIAIRRIAIILVLFYGSSLILNFIQGFIMATVTQRIGQRLRFDISQKINRLPLSYFDKVSHGDILSRVTNDVDVIGQTMSQSIGSLVISIIMFFGSLLIMFINSWILAIIGIASSIIGMGAMAIVAKKAQPHFVRQQEDLGEINGYIEEIYSGHQIVKVYNAGIDAEQTFDDINERLYESGWKSQVISGLMMPLMMFIGNFGYVAVCLAGAILFMNGHIPFGVIVAFMIYIRLINQPLAQMAQALQSFQQAVAAGERVFGFFDEDEMPDESKKEVKLLNTKGNVEFRHVKFGYTPEKLIIKDFSANIKAGQKVAIVGPTGAGKTTIVNLLMRFYELSEGDILIDGISINEASRHDLHNQFCMVLQDTWLFEGSIRENIVYCKENVTDEQIKDACKAVGLHRFIQTLPEGYDTPLNDKANLSQGQKQLLTIARAMIQNAPMLILDEATSSVDTRTEHLIQEAMNQLTVDRTSFVIAHRLSTIKNSDMILVMKDGDIVENGNHHELLAKEGFYAELYNSQFSDVG